ncbi:MAG TPA: tyrosine-type recombinase/integrase [Cyclobacteriaceae bacterium]|jgi:integrase/recombinase XerD|nr:tyrosine-type recombinase/integrase [Cyclobacteriaceae bacterium]
MKKIIKINKSLKKRISPASRVLSEYELWLNKRYGKVGNYLTNSKTFLKTYKDGPEVVYQLDSYMEDMSLTMQSILRRFRVFLQEKEIRFVVNDLLEKKLPLGNIYVKLFLVSHRDRLRGDYSLSTYATVLNQFFKLIDHDLRFFNKKWAEKFIHAPSLSDFTKRLYKSVLKGFCDWALIYQGAPAKELSKEQLLVKKGLSVISTHSLREIANIKVQYSREQGKRYHKESLSAKQRNKLLKLCGTQRERAVVSLLAWNGLRTIEVLRLTVPDCKFREKKIGVWGKGRSSRSKDIIRFFDVPSKEVRKYLKENSIIRGKAFPLLTKKEINNLIEEKFVRMGLTKSKGKFTPHSLRHTAGQIMYDRGVRLEFIQKTLRHASMETTMVYAQKAIDRKYFKAVPSKI